VSSILARESETTLTYLPEPLTEPSVDAAMEFLQLVVPPTVFSSGLRDRRRQQGSSRVTGRKSDQAFLVFYRRGDLEESPQLKPLKSPTSIRKYLTEQANGSAAEHWCNLQLTQYRAHRDGKQVATYTTETGRHILGIVLDLDGKRMAPYHQKQIQNGWVAFRAAVEARLEQLMIEEYYLVRSGPQGAHLYIPLVRPDGLPLRASEKNIARWERAVRGVNRFFSDLGADPNAVRPTQPFVIPGMPRLKWPDFIPHLIVRRQGARTNLFTLLRRLSELKLMPRRERIIPFPSDARHRDVNTILEEITLRAAGVPFGCRNDVAHKVAVYLLCKGATSREAWAAMVAWNKRNDPPLSGRELRRCLSSAERCADRNLPKWTEMQQAPWSVLRGTLELPGGSTGFVKNGRWHPITPAKSWQQRKSEGGREHYEEVTERLLRLVAGQGGGYLQLTQEEIANSIDTNRGTLRAVLERLKVSGRLVVITKKGRGGKTILSIPASEQVYSSVGVTENGHSGNSSEAAQLGAWVGVFRNGVLALASSLCFVSLCRRPKVFLRVIFDRDSAGGCSALLGGRYFERALGRKLSLSASAVLVFHAVEWGWLGLRPLHTGIQDREGGLTMARVLAVASQKGGVGKSTAAVSLSGVALEDGRLLNPAAKVLLIDADPQGNASGDLGVWPESIKGGCADLFDTDKPLEQCIQETKVAGLWLAAGDLTMYQIAEDLVESQPKAERLNILRGKIERFLANDQDWTVIIDTPPDLGLYTKNALIAADRVVAPVNEDIRSVYGLQLLLKTVEGFRMRINRRLSLIGIFRSSWRGDSNYAKSVHRYLDRQYRELQFETEVRQDIRIREAHTDAVPVNFYDPKSRAAEAYRSLWGEIQNRW
jgi:chromosome partitioning protein